MKLVATLVGIVLLSAAAVLGFGPFVMANGFRPDGIVEATWFLGFSGAVTLGMAYASDLEFWLFGEELSSEAD